MRTCTAARAILAAALIVLAGAAAPAEGLRNIASAALVSYFDGSSRVESSDTFLARVARGFTVLVRVSRNDMPGYVQHVFTLGPVVNFSDATYADLSYGLAIDSAGEISHEAEANFNYETESTWAGIGVRAVFFPDRGYYYFLPSFSGKFHLVPALGLFGKVFFSVDSAGVVTNSFWGEAEYTFSPKVLGSVGFTLSRAEEFGFSVLAGVQFAFTPAVSLKYLLQYLSDTVTYLAEPQPRSGISNGLILDWKF